MKYYNLCDPNDYVAFQAMNFFVERWVWYNTHYEYFYTVDKYQAHYLGGPAACLKQSYHNVSLENREIYYIYGKAYNKENYYAHPEVINYLYLLSHPELQAFV